MEEGLCQYQYWKVVKLSPCLLKPGYCEPDFQSERLHAAEQQLANPRVRYYLYPTGMLTLQRTQGQPSVSEQTFGLWRNKSSRDPP